jgi:hypothetical protein
VGDRQEDFSLRGNRERDRLEIFEISQVLAPVSDSDDPPSGQGAERDQTALHEPRTVDRLGGSYGQDLVPG